MMHPLGFGSPLVGPRNEEEQWQLNAQNKKLKKEERFAKIMKRQSAEEVAKAILAQMKEYGAAVLRTHPWNLEYAMAIVAQVRAAMPEHEVELHRSDVRSTYKGQETCDIWLRLCCRHVMEHEHMVTSLRQVWSAESTARKSGSPKGRTRNSGRH